jgi:hypothetical protein
MPRWFQDCKICNEGMVTEMTNRVANGESERTAAAALSKETEIGGLVMYTPESIRRRFRYHTGRVGQNVPAAAVAPIAGDPALLDTVDYVSPVTPLIATRASLHYRVPANFKLSYDQFKEAIQREKENGWADITRDAIVDHLKELIELVDDD